MEYQADDCLQDLMKIWNSTATDDDEASLGFSLLAIMRDSKWPGLTAEKLIRALEGDRDKLEKLGYEVQLCFLNSADTAEEDVKKILEGAAFDCALIGAGVRKVDDHFLVFEKLVNVVHNKAPEAKICFNTGPNDSVEAVQRWI